MGRSKRDFDRLDPTLFRAFMAAVEAENFTKAAQAIAMTQSGVSQHIAKLEEQVGVSLFKRVNKSVLLTDAGRMMVAHIERYLDDTEAFYESLQQGAATLSGRVVYAMPESCVLAPHLGMMLRKRAKEHPDIDLRIHIQANADIVHGILAGDLDFGFVTKTFDVPGLKTVAFCEEEFVLISPKGDLAEGATLEQILEAGFVSYPGMELYFDAWQEHYFPRLKKRLSDSVLVRGSIEDIRGAVTMVSEGVGSTVVPKHCAFQELAKKTVAEIHPAAKQSTVKNTICIATVHNDRPTKRAQRVRDWFFDMHPEIAR